MAIASYVYTCMGYQIYSVKDLATDIQTAQNLGST